MRDINIKIHFSRLEIPKKKKKKNTNKKPTNMGESVLKLSIHPCRYKINLSDSYHCYLFISARVCVSSLWRETVSVISFEVPSEMICCVHSEELHSLMVAHATCC